MDLLTKLHCRLMFLMPSVLIGSIAILLLVEKYLGYLIPSWVIAVATLGCLFVDAAIRISFWRKKNNYLSEEDASSNGAKIFISIVPIEIIVGIIGMFIIFS